MIRVALVEDEESSQRTLTEYLERFSQEINEKIHVSIFPDGAEIVEDYRGNYDIIPHGHPDALHGRHGSCQ